MLRVRGENAMIAAVLHDVVEDTDWTLDGLREKGFSEKVLAAVEALTKRTVTDETDAVIEEEDYDTFIERVSHNEIATAVKLADLEDNMNIMRITDLRPKDLARIEKYHAAWHRLRRLARENGYRIDPEP